MKTAIIYDKWLAGLGGGEVVACSMARVLNNAGYRVTLVSQTEIKPGLILKTLDIDISDIKLVIIKDDEEKLKELCYGKDLFINISFMDYSNGYAKRNIYYVHFPTVSNKKILSYLAKNRVLTNLYTKYLLAFPSGIFNYVLTFFKVTRFHRFLSPKLKEKIDDRLRAGIYYNLFKRLDSYQLFVTHSKYVQKWIKKEWDIDAKVLYPPVKLLCHCEERSDEAIPTGSPRPFGARDDKRNWIVSVGRFFTLGHGKKQEVMIEAFKVLYNSLNSNNKIQMSNQILNSKFQTTDNLQLHLVGGVGNEPSSLRFIQDLREQAKGYPIYFHYNVDRREVEDILLKSKIYWHATGFGENPEKDPIKFEHFGIAPVEAISAGCIPVLFDGGGLREIIMKLGLNPKMHLFTSSDMLIQNTLNIMRENIVLDWSNINSKLHKNFSSALFKSRFIKIINEKT